MCEKTCWRCILFPPSFVSIQHCVLLAFFLKFSKICEDANSSLSSKLYSPSHNPFKTSIALRVVEKLLLCYLICSTYYVLYYKILFCKEIERNGMSFVHVEYVQSLFFVFFLVFLVFF